MAAGGIDVIVRAVDAHINDENLCFVGCAALSTMSLNGKGIVSSTTKNSNDEPCDFIAEGQMKAVTVGGIEAVIKAINSHVHNPDVCENGCYALYNMIFDNGKKTIIPCSFFM